MHNYLENSKDCLRIVSFPLRTFQTSQITAADTTMDEGIHYVLDLSLAKMDGPSSEFHCLTTGGQLASIKKRSIHQYFKSILNTKGNRREYNGGNGEARSSGCTLLESLDPYHSLPTGCRFMRERIKVMLKKSYKFHA